MRWEYFDTHCNLQGYLLGKIKAGFVNIAHQECEGFGARTDLH